MNAYTQTADLIARAITARPLARQTVHRASTIFGHGRTRYIVLVIPEGAEQGEYYEVSTKRALDDLRFYTPEEMGLDPLDPAEVDGDADEDDGIPTDADLRREFNSRVL